MSTTQLLQDLTSLLPIGEKKKLLNQYLNHVQESEVNDVLKECQELKSSQLNLLKLFLGNKFRRSDLIIGLLYDGEKAIINKAVVKSWLYASETIGGQLTNTEFLLNNFFPNVSYNCRKKVLNATGRFVHNERQVDTIWNGVEERYGFYAALPLLQACTKGKINSVISERKFELVGYQLLQIIQKYPDVGLEYLRHHYKRTIGIGTYSYNKSLSYLFKNHADEFLDLFLSHSDKMQCTFGKSRSTYMIRTYKKLLEHPKKFNSILRLNQIQKEFCTDDFQIFFESTLSDNPDYIDARTTSKWVKKMPIHKRLSMIRSAFLKLYQINLDEHPEYMSPDYIILLPDEKRLSVIQWKHDNDKNYSWSIDDFYFYFYGGEEQKYGWTPLKPTSHSVPELQKLLLIEQDVGTRAALSKCLIVTCYVNHDLPKLLNILILLSKRSRNDLVEVRIEIFRAICSIMNEMEFTKEHWDVIIEMIQVSLVFKDSRDTSDSEKEKILDKSIEFHLKSKLPMNNIINMLVKVKIQRRSMTWTNSHINNPADQRTLLELFVKELENFQTKRGTNYINSVSLECIASLIEEICKFNKRYVKPSNAIEPILIASHQWLRNSLEKIVKAEEKLISEKWIRNKRYSWNFAKQLFNIIQTLTNEQKLSLDASKNVEDLFSTILLALPSEAIFLHFLRENRSKLNENWSSVLPTMLKTESKLHFIGRLKSLNYATLVAQSIKICLEIVNRNEKKDSSEIHQKCNAVLVLSVLSEAVDFLLLAAQFYPLESKLDVFAENSDEDYQIRQTFSKSLVNVSVPHLALPVIEKFCVGEYFKFVVGSLYSQADYASESKSIEFLRQQIFNTRTSLQKHIIRHFFKICSVQDKVRFLKEMKSSTNVSIRHEIFLQASELFKSVWSKDVWTIFKSIIGKICQDDASTITHLQLFPNFDTCAPEFLYDYIQACLKLLRKGKANQVDNFMVHLEVMFDKIAEKTLDDIVLHKYEEQVSFNYSFIAKYLLHSSTVSILSHRLSNVWLLLQNVIRNGWDITTSIIYDPNGADYPTKTSVFTFISTLCMEHLNDSSKLWVERQILQTLLENLKVEFMTKLFKEILYIELSLQLLAESEKIGIEKLKAFGRRLGQFTDSLVKTYGGEIISIVNDTVQPFVESCCDKTISYSNGVIVVVIDGILEASRSRHNQMTSISLSQKVNPKASSLKETFEKIKTKLGNSDDVVVQIYYDYVNIK